MNEKHDITEDALLRIRKGIEIDDYERFDTLGYVPCHELTKEQLEKLQELNLKLAGYEKEIKKQVLDMHAFADKKEKDPDDWIEQFYSCEVDVGFYLKEDDPHREEEDDNLIMVMNNSFLTINSIYGLADGDNHNEFAHRKDHIMYGDYHCWTFHGLYDHTQLMWEDILRIGDIEVDITLELNKYIKEDRKIETNSKPNLS